MRTLDEAALSRIRNRKIGFVFQSFNLIPRTTALANVELPLLYAGVQGRERRGAGRARRSPRSGSPTAARHFPNEMSGGQQQRVALARAIVTSPALVLADEPTGNLDTATSDEIMGMFSRLNAGGRTVVLITHEEDIAAYAKRTVRLRDGLIVDDRTTRSGRRRCRRALDGRGRSLLGTAAMNVARHARIAWRGATANKLRSALTVLGVLIGVAAVIILLAVGTGSSQAVQNRIKALGTNTITVLEPRPLRPRPRDDRDAVAEREPHARSRSTAIEDPEPGARRRLRLAGRLDDRDGDLRRGELLDAR